MTRNQFRALAAIAALVAVGLVAVPVFGVDPSPSASTAIPSDAPASAEPSVDASTEPSSAPPAAASAEPPAPAPAATFGPPAPENGNNQKPDKAAKPDKGPKTPEHPVTLTGVVGQSADGEDYTLRVGSTVYVLSAGPKWWWGDASPLAGAVGETVTIDGEQAEGSDEVDVLAIDGTAVRAAGKPPWAGGWKVVGERHPGWAQWKVDKLSDRGHGKDGAPGQLKKDDTAP